ncbi:MAG: hypothetical protein AAGI01_18025 [Myxococcota bacterium]
MKRLSLEAYLIFGILLYCSTPALGVAQEAQPNPPIVEYTSERHRARLDVPLLDLPYNANPWYTGPGMGLSVGITSGVYTGMQVGLSAAFHGLMPSREGGVLRIVG